MNDDNTEKAYQEHAEVKTDVSLGHSSHTDIIVNDSVKVELNMDIQQNLVHEKKNTEAEDQVIEKDLINENENNQSHGKDDGVNIVVEAKDIFVIANDAEKDGYNRSVVREKEDQKDLEVNPNDEFSIKVELTNEAKVITKASENSNEFQIDNKPNNVVVKTSSFQDGVVPQTQQSPNKINFKTREDFDQSNTIGDLNEVSLNLNETNNEPKFNSKYYKENVFLSERNNVVKSSNIADTQVGSKGNILVSRVHGTFTGNYDYLFKIALIGDSGSGKTTILLRYSEGMYKYNTQSTIGVDFKIVSLNVNNEIVKLQIWDTCGSERFKSITASFIKSCSAYILTFDITSAKTFNNLNTWMKFITESTNANFYCLIGNKADLHLKRQVSQAEAIRFAEKHSLRYLETSALEGVNIEEVFSHVTAKIYEEVKEKTKVINPTQTTGNLGHSKAIGFNVSTVELEKEEKCGC